MNSNLSDALVLDLVVQAYDIDRACGRPAPWIRPLVGIPATMQWLSENIRKRSCWHGRNGSTWLRQAPACWEHGVGSNPFGVLNKMVALGAKPSQWALTAVLCSYSFQFHLAFLLHYQSLPWRPLPLAPIRLTMTFDTVATAFRPPCMMDRPCIDSCPWKGLVYPWFPTGWTLYFVCTGRWASPWSVHQERGYADRRWVGETVAGCCRCRGRLRRWHGLKGRPRLPRAPGGRVVPPIRVAGKYPQLLRCERRWQPPSYQNRRGAFLEGLPAPTSCRWVR